MMTTSWSRPRSQLGYQGIALGRTLPHPPARVPWIESLDGVLDWLPPACPGVDRVKPG